MPPSKCRKKISHFRHLRRSVQSKQTREIHHVPERQKITGKETQAQRKRRCKGDDSRKTWKLKGLMCESRPPKNNRGEAKAIYGEPTHWTRKKTTSKNKCWQRKTP